MNCPPITVMAARAKELQLALTKTRSSTKPQKGDQGLFGPLVMPP